MFKVPPLSVAWAVADVVLSAAAFAADSTTSATAQATLSGGTLNISSALQAGTFTGTLLGASQELTGVGFSGFSINDPRGTGVGWNVTMVATPFVNGDVRTAPDDLTVNSFTAPLFGVAKVDTGSSAVPGMGTLTAATIDTGGGAVVVAECDEPGQGMGTYNFTALDTAWKLALTADEYAGTYSSTVTTTLATLPLG